MVVGAPATRASWLRGADVVGEFVRLAKPCLYSRGPCVAADVDDGVSGHLFKAVSMVIASRAFETVGISRVEELVGFGVGNFCVE